MLGNAPKMFALYLDENEIQALAACLVAAGSRLGDRNLMRNASMLCDKVEMQCNKQEDVLATIQGLKMTARKQNKVKKVMHEYKTNTLHSGTKKGPKVTSRKQAVAIALSEQRKARKK